MRAWRWFEDPANHEEAVAIIAKFMRAPAADLQYVFTKDDYYRDPYSHPDIAGLQNAIDVSRELGVIPATIKVDPKYVDLSFVDEAERRIKAAP